MTNKKFKLPTKSDLKSRTSTLNNAFAISITPYINPTFEETERLYECLQINEGQCAYCLGEANAVDHIKPLVTNGLPTGYITEIRNLVPCCAACNSAKGAKDFKVWYKEDKNIKRLHKKGMTDAQIEERYRIICAYMEQIPEPINYQELLGDDLWREYLARKTAMIKLLKTDQEFCNKLSNIIKEKIEAEKK